MVFRRYCFFCNDYKYGISFCNNTSKFLMILMILMRWKFRFFWLMRVFWWRRMMRWRGKLVKSLYIISPLVSIIE
jgi:hypothetical protein